MTVGEKISEIIQESTKKNIDETIDKLIIVTYSIGLNFSSIIKEIKSKTQIAKEYKYCPIFKGRYLCDMTVKINSKITHVYFYKIDKSVLNDIFDRINDEIKIKKMSNIEIINKNIFKN